MFPFNGRIIKHFARIKAVAWWSGINNALWNAKHGFEFLLYFRYILERRLMAWNEALDVLIVGRPANRKHLYAGAELQIQLVLLFN
jgi:hypothetical protein